MIYMVKVAFNELSSSLKAVNQNQTDERFFEGLLTVEMKDKQGEVTIVDELYKVLPVWMDRGAPITDTHSNRIIGKGINYAKTVVKNQDGVELPAIKITGKIYKNYELDNLIWEKIKRNEYKGLSFGGATRSQRTPMRMKDGSMAYALTDLEHYEVAVCKDPAVPMAIITDFNPIAKAQFNSEKRDDGKLLIRCSGMGCYVDKADLSEEDTFEAKVRKLMSEGKSRESAEKIVGSFVKKERGELYIPKRGFGVELPEEESEDESKKKKISKTDDEEDDKEKDDQNLSELNERTKGKLTRGLKKLITPPDIYPSQIKGIGGNEKDKNDVSASTDDGFNARYSEKDKEEGDDSKEQQEYGRDHSDSSGDHHSMYNQDGANAQRLNTVNRSITEINQAVTNLNQYVINEVSKGKKIIDSKSGTYIRDNPEEPEESNSFGWHSHMPRLGSPEKKDGKNKADTTVNQQGGVRNDISGINRQGSLDPTDASGLITPVKDHKEEDEDEDKDKHPAEKETEGTKEHETNKAMSGLSGLI